MGDQLLPRHWPTVYEASLSHQRGSVGIAAAEGSVGLGSVDRVAFGKDLLAEPRCHGRIPRTVSLDKGLPGIGREHVGPEVAVVGR